jgi:hypothetical protein
MDIRSCGETLILRKQLVVALEFSREREYVQILSVSWVKNGLALGFSLIFSRYVLD